MDTKTYFILRTLMFFHGIYGLQYYKNNDVQIQFYEEICPSKVYCHGELLEDVQMSRLFPDSKIFVDMKMTRNETEIVDAYTELKNQYGGNVPQDELLDFVNENFDDDVLIEWKPTDFTDHPDIANKINDSNYKTFALDVNQIWKQLARKVSKDAIYNPQRYSSIYLPNGFFIAGGRFKEMYYWDSYWTIKGALLCEMSLSVKGILLNMIYLVKKYGYMLNGSRVYYEKRSQPPLLMHMFYIYYTLTNDKKMIIKHLKYLEQEVIFWLKHRTIIVDKGENEYIMGQYNTRTYGPRPESYFEDKILAQKLPETIDDDDLYVRIKSAAESGWDFSTKHFNNYEYDNGTLIDTDPQNFIYVELNSILQSNCDILSKFFELSGNLLKANEYKAIAERFQVGIDALLWNEEEGIWLDYDLKKGTSRRNKFYASNLAPLWTGSYNKMMSRYYGNKAVQYLINNQIINEDLNLNYICVPTSLIESGQQWDYPNCWPPLQSMLINGLDDTNSERAKKVAFNIANSWIQTNYNGYKKSGYMYEKYSAIYFGESGDGGEYTPQTGFGWTNGLLYEILNKYGDVLESYE